MDKMEKVRAAKKPPEYKNVCEYVKGLPDDHKASLKEVKSWEKHNRDIVKNSSTNIEGLRKVKRRISYTER